MEYACRAICRTLIWKPRPCFSRPALYTTGGMLRGRGWKETCHSLTRFSILAGGKQDGLLDAPTGKRQSCLGASVSDRILAYAHLARVHRPIGIWLLYFPCAWSIQMASFSQGHLINASMLALFLAGAAVMRSAGCTINDLWDRRIDAQVERTRHRPIAAGTIAPSSAVLFLGAQLALGLGILCQLPRACIGLGLLSLVPVTLYPLMKRVTYWPQAVLGLTFSWGALLGMPSVLGACPWTVTLPLYFGGFFWTLIYDTIYAHQDKKDDAIVSVKSTALRFGARTAQYLSFFSACALCCFNVAGVMNGQGWVYFSLLNTLGPAHLCWQIWRTNYDDPSDCHRKFVASQYFGLGLFLVLLLDTMHSIHLAA